MPIHRPTIQDVARHAHVGVGTASRALTGVGAVSAQTRRRVLDAAVQLGFSPRVAAVSLRGRRPPIIAVASYFSRCWPQFEILGGVSRALELSDFHMLLSPLNLQRSPGAGARIDAWIADALGQRLIGGLIAVTEGSVGGATLDLAVREGLPVVTVEFRYPGAHSVEADQRLGGALAARRLGRRVRRFIALSVRPDLMPAVTLFRERIEGFRAGLARAGHPPASCTVVEARALGFAEGVRLGRRLASKLRPPAGIFVATGDEQALGLWRGLQAAGARPRRDFALVGYDGLPLAVEATPPLTTIRQPLEPMGGEAARLVMAGFRGALREPAASRLRPALVRGGTD